MPPFLKDKKVWSWAIYDWANSAFATTVMAGFFPLFFKQYWSSGSAQESTLHLGIVSSVTSLLLAFLAPSIGYFADHRSNKKSVVIAFTLLGAFSTMGLFFPGKGEALWPLIFFAVGSFAFNAGIIAYDSMLVDVTKGERMDAVSGFGFSLGYLGGALLFLLNVVMFLKPQIFGIANGSTAIRISFLMVGLWWLVFALPLIFNVPNQKAKNKESVLLTFKKSISHVSGSLRYIYGQRRIFYFLLGYLFYIDAVNTIIKMAVDFGLAIGLQAQDLIVALLITNFIGFPAAILYSWWGEKIGVEKAIFTAIGIYFGISCIGFGMSEAWHFYALAAGVGIVQGGIQALSRSYFARLIPAHRSGELFGFFNVMGKFSAIFGPILMGVLAILTGDPRVSILVVVVFLGLGAFFFNKQRREALPTNSNPA